MTENKPMRAFESFFPEPLHVDEVGWERFLNQWNSEALELIKQKLLALGIGLGPNVNESLRKKLESHHVFLPSEIFVGGLSYPPRTEGDRFEAERRLRLMKDAIPKIKPYEPPWFKEFEWEALINGGLHYPRASTEMIEQAEQRLSVRFPRSYRDFLSVSNGWLTDQEIFLPVEKVGRLQDEDPGLVADWYGGIASDISDEDYFQYDLSKQYPIHIRVQYLPDCLLLSEHYGISSRWYLLNPAIRFDDGEWEAWCLEPRIAGAQRFRSFKAMMEWLYMESIAGLRKSIYDMT